MSIKKSVFASKQERTIFLKLSRQWGSKYNVYHNLPFLNVVDEKDLCDSSFPHEPFVLAADDFNRLKKTSIDYTLCDQADVPLMCLEFDGLQQGINRGAKYIPSREPISPYRNQFMELKLKVALGSGLPYFVLGSSYFDELSASTRLTIVDGIIGDVMTKLEFQKLIRKGFAPSLINMSESDFDSLPPIDQNELVQDWAMITEIETEAAINPLFEYLANLHMAVGYFPGTSIPRTYPEIDRTLPSKEYSKLFDLAKMYGMEHSMHTKQGSVTKTCWMPNFDVPYYSGFGLIDTLAEIMVLEEIKRKGWQKPLIDRC